MTDKLLLCIAIVSISGALMVLIVRKTRVARNIIAPLLFGVGVGFIILRFTLPTVECKRATAMINDKEIDIGERCSYRNSAGVEYKTSFKADPTPTYLSESDLAVPDLNTPVRCGSQFEQCIYYIATETGLEIRDPVAPAK